MLPAASHIVVVPRYALNADLYFSLLTTPGAYVIGPVEQDSRHHSLFSPTNTSQDTWRNPLVSVAIYTVVKFEVFIKRSKPPHDSSERYWFLSSEPSPCETEGSPIANSATNELSSNMSSKTSSSPSASRSSHSHHRRHHTSVTKLLLILHALNAVFSLLSISIFIAIVPVWNANFFHSRGALRGDWPDGLPILPLSITFLMSVYYLTRLILAQWSPVKSGDYLKSRHTSKEKPKASKTTFYLTLATLILLLTFLILAAVSGLYRFWRPAVITSSVELSSGKASTSTTLSTLSLRRVVRSLSDTTPTTPSLTPPESSPSATNSKATFHSCTLANVFTRRCNPTLYLLGDLQIAAISSASFVWLLNFVMLVLQIRDRQYQKRRNQRSLRAKARSKLDLIEDEMSRAEKGDSLIHKKIHHERRKGHGKSPSDPSLPSTDVPRVTRPARAYTTTQIKAEAEQGYVRPKQHYYNPNITPSRSRSTREPTNDSGTSMNSVTSAAEKVSASVKPSGGAMFQNRGQTPYSRAVDEARRKVRPAETMRDWLAGRN